MAETKTDKKPVRADIGGQAVLEGVMMGSPFPSAAPWVQCSLYC